jgi:hypothetical protein
LLSKKNIKNLYLVSSPFQCISAIEAKKQLNLNNNVLVVIYYLKDGNSVISQIRDTLSVTQWDEIIEIGIEKKKSKFSEYISAIKKLKKESFKNLLAGDFGQFSAILMANLKIENIYAIDDGIGTMKWHENELNPNLENYVKFSKKIKMLRYLLFGLKTSYDKKKINYFTMFDLRPYYGEKIIKNEFTFMRDYVLSKKQNNGVVYFLGQALLEDKWVKNKDYIQFLKFIKNYFVLQNIKIVYIPHRREKNLKDLDCLIDENFEIKSLSLPVELYLFSVDKFPFAVCSFMSTALYSIQKIFAIKTMAFYINQKDILENHDDIENRYNELKSSGVEIVELKNKYH